ncbi:LysM peptidoglycan-binding domain-containing protein [Macrococcus lamae]|uniref:LysM peptidoglycan-binding domain-containing protein n=1 Tax=Macrococcus lamae TaxID=198484 RepID=A0A4R6BUF8_9STAP|nr:LysM peptidoglycan-binding domain-containing protein [Macrococcus lamae]TDM10509.1 LysM peptidoglycan-binding domain-containing protein [Macrococcus lamae]
MKKLLAVTTAVAVSGTFAATADAAEHTVQSGDTLWGISKNYGTSVEAIKAENGLKSNLIVPNQVLKVNEETKSEATKTYKIVYGDTLGKIAAKFNVSVAQLKAWNNLSSDLIIAGKTLNVTGSVQQAAPAVQSAPATVAAPKKVYTAPKAVETTEYKAPVQQTTYQAPKQQVTYQAPVQQQTYQAPKQQVTYQAPKAVQTQPAATTQTSTAGSGLNWAAMAACESGGNPSTNTGNGFYGLYQFDVQTWQSVGGSGLPSNASAAEQTKRAQILYSQRGSQPWPVCGARL